MKREDFAAQQELPAAYKRGRQPEQSDTQVRESRSQEQNAPASPESAQRPAVAAPRFRRSCVLCGVDTKDLEEHECSLEDLMENAARNADDQIGTYG